MLCTCSAHALHMLCTLRLLPARPPAQDGYSGLWVSDGRALRVKWARPEVADAFRRSGGGGGGGKIIRGHAIVDDPTPVLWVRAAGACCCGCLLWVCAGVCPLRGRAAGGRFLQREAFWGASGQEGRCRSCAGRRGKGAPASMDRHGVPRRPGLACPNLWPCKPLASHSLQSILHLLPFCSSCHIGGKHEPAGHRAAGPEPLLQVCECAKCTPRYLAGPAQGGSWQLMSGGRLLRLD